MYRFVLIVVLTTLNATVAVHLGLSVAIGKILSKILSCPKCLSFWSSLALLYLFGCNLALAVLLSLLSAYISSWLALLLVRLNQKYEELWQKVSKK